MGLMDSLAIDMYGMTAKEAIINNICIGCKEPIHIYNMTAIDIKEYNISGLCAKCFDLACDMGDDD